MTKSLIAAFVVVGMAVAANAQSLQGSQQSLQGSEDTLGASATIVFVDGSGRLSTAVAAAATATGHALEDGALYILNTPSVQMSDDSVAGSKAVWTFAVDSTGRVVGAIQDGSLYVLNTPSTQMSTDAKNASVTAIQVTVDSAGRVSAATGAYLSNKFSGPLTEMSTGSGVIVTASGNAIVTVYQDAKGALVNASAAVSAEAIYLKNGIVTSTEVSLEDARAASVATLYGQFHDSSTDSAASVPNASQALVTGGTQY